MALNFPDSPTLNQEVELGGKTYRWDGVKWRMVYVVTPTAQSLAPTITEVSVTETSITFTITNNDTDSAVILYEVGDNTPDENSIELAASATSSNIEITGLTAETTYTVYAWATVTDKVQSPLTSLGIETEPTPLTYISATASTSTTTLNITDFRENQENNSVNPYSFRSRSDTNIIGFDVSAYVGAVFNFTNPQYVGAVWTLDVNLNETSPPKINSLQQSTFSSFDMTQSISIPTNTKWIYVYSHEFNINNWNGVTWTQLQTVRINILNGVESGTYEDNGTFYKYYAFKSSGTFTVNSLSNQVNGNDIDYVLIGGGGGGNYEGAGGAGGYLTTLTPTSNNVPSQSKITLLQQSYNIVIGAGAAGSLPNTTGNNGVNTSAFGITALGGGGGGGNSSFNIPSQTGASGGGGGANASGANGTNGQGFAGANGSGTNGGGGGGAGGAASGSTGGIGLASTITGTSVSRAGGGGGGVLNGTSTATSGGGIGQGANASGFGELGTGGGGGGAWNRNGGNGGSGLLVIRYIVGGLE